MSAHHTVRVNAEMAAIAYLDALVYHERLKLLVRNSGTDLPVNICTQLQAAEMHVESRKHKLDVIVSELSHYPS